VRGPARLRFTYANTALAQETLRMERPGAGAPLLSARGAAATVAATPATPVAAGHWLQWTTQAPRGLPVHRVRVRLPPLMMRARGGVKRQRMGISASWSLVTQLVVSPPPARACAYVVCASVRAYADGCDPGGAVVIPAIGLADVYPCQACSCHGNEVGNAARWAGAGRSPWGTCCCR
jgi:hypothetical protein